MSDELARRASAALAAAEDESKSRLRKWVRSLFESDANVREVLLEAKPASSARVHLQEMLSDRVRESDGPVLLDVIDELLGELDRQRADEPGLYLVDGRTGKSLMRLREEGIYQPPDYVGEDGVRRRAKPVLHPGIAAPMAMAAHEGGRLEEALARPGSAAALAFARDPGTVAAAAEAALVAMGYEPGPRDGSLPVEGEAEVGREYYDPLQSLNDSFHRHSAFGAALARKVAEAMRSSASRRFEILEPVQMRSSKQRWLTVRFRHG